MCEWCAGLTRRQLLAVGAAVGAAGCSGRDETTETPSPTESSTAKATETESATPTPTVTSEPTHQLADTTTTVRVIDKSSSEHNLEAITREALDYWEAEAREYVDFDVEFTIRNIPTSRIQLEFIDDARSCGIGLDTREILGCAPLLSVGDPHLRDIETWVLAANRPRGRILTTTKHEIGHILGLDHDDEPAEIMSNDPADRIPGYELRMDIWTQFEDVRFLREDGIAQNQIAIEFWNREQYRDAEEAFIESENIHRKGVELIERLLDSANKLSEIDAETLDEPRLIRLFEMSHSWFKYRAESASYMAEASDRIARNQNHVRHFNLAQEALDKADSERVATLNEIGVSLGLDQPII